MSKNRSLALLPSAIEAGPLSGDCTVAASVAVAVGLGSSASRAASADGRSFSVHTCNGIDAALSERPMRESRLRARSLLRLSAAWISITPMTCDVMSQTTKSTLW